LRPRRARSPATAAPAPLLRFAIAGALGREGATRRALRAARARGVPRRACEETALMLVLYAGYPAALEALRMLNEVWPGRARGGREGDPGAWRRRGEALCRRVYGPSYSRLVARVRSLHPDLARCMVEQGYGRVLSRPGLGVRAREALTVAVLAATGRERQLVSHLEGARRVGVTGAGARHALRVALAAGAPRATVRRAWGRAWGAGVDPMGGTP
jgi:4-carboxymuconolactone decarboxylase